MGKKKTTVGTTITRAIEDKHLPNAIKTALNKALFSDEDIVDNVLEELSGSIGVRAERMYEYAKRGDYVHGLPSGQYSPGVDGVDEVTAVLETLEGGPIEIIYSHFGPPNNLHFGWTFITQYYEYNPVTNQLPFFTGTFGTPVWLEDLVVVIPSVGAEQLEELSLRQWGLSANSGYTPLRTAYTPATRKLAKPSPVEIDTALTYEYLLGKTVRMVAGVPTRYNFVVAVEGLDDQANYFHVKYVVGGVTKYWTYRDGAGTYPVLDAVFDREPLPNGSFFPFAYFRYDNVSEIADTSTEAYRSSKKLVKYLGMDYDQIADAIDQNPDIADVKQAMMIMAVPANTVDPLERRYLWSFFNNLYLALDVDQRFKSEEAALLAGVDFYAPGPATLGMIIQDTRFKMSVDNDGIYKRRVAGNIGPVGSYDSGFTMKDYRQYSVNPMTEEVVSFVIRSAAHHYYRRQVSVGFYDEIIVVGMQTRFHIFEQYLSIGDENDSILLIPLDRAITAVYPITEREVLYSRSLHYVFNSLVVTKIKWYQTGLFKAVLIIIAILIIYFSWGTATNEALWLIAVGEYLAASAVIFVLVTEYLILQYAFKLIVKAVGVKAAIVIAVIAAMIGVVGAFNAGGLANAPWAQQLLSVSSGLVNGVNNVVASNMEDLLESAERFGIFKEEQNKVLDTAKELLENRVFLDPFVIFGEFPQDYYNRTVHSGNIGVVGLDAISMYVDVSLTLPKLNETIGDTL